ncbi:MAG: phosphatidate cytidylyltransferase [Bryobacterales bacterium]|nr:phosphatidate cytidylyltransferase [Bryobacterales bacterium]
MKRVLTALVLIPVALGAIFKGGPWVVLSVVAAFATLCFLELASIGRGYGLGLPRSAQWLGVAAGCGFLALPGHEGIYLAAIALAAAAWTLAAADLATGIPRAGMWLLAFLYVFGPWRCAVLLHALSPMWLLFALAINWIGDISAFYFGRAFGRHKLASRVSPGKSWEGAAASAVTGAAFGLLLLPRMSPAPLAAAPPWIEIVLLSVAVNALGQVGDLTESALKRGAGMKDSGTLLPGHGGFLDRLDSTLFTVPAVYLYLLLRA